MTGNDEGQSVLVVDDNSANIDILVDVLGDDYELSVAMNGAKALVLAAQTHPDLILLDIMMPEMDGYEVCRRLKADPATAGIPVIFVTAMSEISDETRGFEAGAVDYITKPLSPAVVQARVKTHLALADQRLACQQTVERQLSEIMRGQEDAISMLGLAGHYNDDSTGAHIWRMAHYAKRLARQAGWPIKRQNMLQLAAPMHDTGKIGVPDGILRKRGELDEEERAIMRNHTIYGHRILSVAKTPLFRMASAIALYHHERWDGSGYPERLAGDAIPEEARIVALADVFDALTSQRPYKQAWSVDSAFEFIADSDGHFDPHLAGMFCALKDELVGIRKHWAERENELTKTV